MPDDPLPKGTVPAEPTPAMIEAGRRALDRETGCSNALEDGCRWCDEGHRDSCRAAVVHVWREMLEASHG